MRQRTSGRTRRGVVRIGTSGWAYDWPSFYPPDVRDRDRLRHYATRFDTVEVNTSFYHLPRESTYDGWRATAPPGFVFALKIHRWITHVKRLRGVRLEVRRFLGGATRLGDALGPILVQLPASVHADGERLAVFLDVLASEATRAGIRRPRVALEVRHASWFDCEPALAALADHDAALVFAHSPRYPYPERERATAGWTFLRLHGPGAMFASEYGTAGLRPWANRVKRWSREGRDVYVYFNNDVNGYAHRDARRLAAQVERR